MLLTRTPMRVSLFGGGTDIESFSNIHGGATFSFSIAQYVYLIGHPLVESKEILIKYSENERVADPKKIKHNVFRELLIRYQASGFDIGVTSDVSAGTGLGSSSSFTVGLSHLLRSNNGLPCFPDQLAKDACEIEIDILKQPIGVQDQYAAAYGGLNLIEVANKRQVSVRPYVIDSEIEEILSQNMLLVRVPGARSASQLLANQNSRENQEANLSTLLEMKEMALSGHSILQSGPKVLGAQLHYSWMLKKTLSKDISNLKIDSLYDELLAEGVYGGKLLGAGGSGYFLIVAERSIIQQILEKRRTDGILPVNLDRLGSKLIYDSSRDFRV